MKDKYLAKCLAHLSLFTQAEVNVYFKQNVYKNA